MREAALVQELDGVAQLVGDVPYVLDRIWLVVVVFLQSNMEHALLNRTVTKRCTARCTYQEVENTQPKHLESDTRMAVVVEPV